MNEKICFISLGCDKNRVDTEVMMGFLTQEGHKIEENPEEATVIVVNTCVFIKEAKEESIETILEVLRYKEEGRCDFLIVTGCMTQRYKKKMLKLFPEADFFIGTGEFHRIGEVISQFRAGIIKEKLLISPPTYLYNDTTPRYFTSLPGTAFVKISEGCSSKCSYCVIPAVRGKMRSRPLESVVKEIEKLAAMGVKEVIIVAQDITEYGKDLGRNVRIEKLLDRILRIDGFEWIRLLYAYPRDLSDEFLGLLNEDRICNYLDIPIQHINTDILKRMGRNSNPHIIRNTIQRIRDKVPGIWLRTSLIVGFPGETDENFDELVTFVEEAEFEWLGAFMFSREEGTKAAQMAEQVPKKVKKKRYQKIMKMQAQITQKKNESLLGTVQKALIEEIIGTSKTKMIGRLQVQAPLVDGEVYILDNNAHIGEIKDVFIMKTDFYDLVGKSLI